MPMILISRLLFCFENQPFVISDTFVFAERTMLLIGFWLTDEMKLLLLKFNSTDVWNVFHVWGLKYQKDAELGANVSLELPTYSWVCNIGVQFN